MNLFNLRGTEQVTMSTVCEMGLASSANMPPFIHFGDSEAARPSLCVAYRLLFLHCLGHLFVIIIHHHFSWQYRGWFCSSTI